MICFREIAGKVVLQCLFNIFSENIAYVGCFVDKYPYDGTSNVGRTLNVKLNLTPSALTVETCVTACRGKG